MENQEKVLQRFLSKIQKTDTCWLWTASKNGQGYANITAYKNGKTFMAIGSRVAWELFRGPVPEGLCVLHTCDVRHCVNPEHLFLGTKRDNSDDMIRKGREKHIGLKGPLNPNSKLTWKQARQIRSLYATGDFSERFLSEIYKVSHSVIRDVLTNKSYITNDINLL